MHSKMSAGLVDAVKMAKRIITLAKQLGESDRKLQKT